MTAVGLTLAPAAAAAQDLLVTADEAQDEAPPAAVSPPRRARAVPPRAATEAAKASKSAEQASPLVRIVAALAPHGSWLEHPRYGKVWLPREDAEQPFAPYLTDGRWAVDDRGAWTWVSEKPWGDLVFHYGRWVWTRDRGWAWIPGTDYAPAHLLWRLGGPEHEFVGWAPQSPARYWIEDAPVRQSGGALPFWFVSKQQLTSASLKEHVVDDPAFGRRLLAQSSLAPLEPAPSRTPRARAGVPAAQPPDLDQTLAALEAAATPAAAAPSPYPPPERPVRPAEDTALVPTPDAERAETRERLVEEPRARKRVCWFTHSWPREKRCRYR